MEKHFGKVATKISAQTYLRRFYKAHGFEQTGSEYLEDGIPHIAMLRP
jgi:ElaA protein